MVFESRIFNENYVLLLNPVVSRSITTLFSWTSFRWSIFANPGFGTASGMVWMPTCSDSPTSEDIQIVLNLCKGSNKSLINPKTRVCNYTVPEWCVSPTWPRFWVILSCFNSYRRRFFPCNCDISCRFFFLPFIVHFLRVYLSVITMG